MRVKVLNDDGFDSLGIKVLHRALKHAGHTVYLVAPAKWHLGLNNAGGGGSKVTRTKPDAWRRRMFDPGSWKR